MKLFTVILFLVFWSTTMSQTKATDDLKANFKTAIIDDNAEAQKNIANQLKSSYTSNTYSFYNMMLNAVPADAILITNGLEDTYVLKIIQLTANVKTNVEIVSLGLLADNTYKNLVKENTQITLSNSNNKSELIGQIVKQKGNKAYFSTTINPNNYVGLSQSLFNYGLVLNSNGSKQAKQLQTFWYVFKQFNITKKKLSVLDNQIYQNILPALLTLYKLELESVNQKELLDTIKNVANQLNKTEIVTKIIEGYKN